MELSNFDAQLTIVQPLPPVEDMALIKTTLNELDLSYIAGFFDGEGSVTIHHNYAPSPRGKSPNHTLQVSIGNTDPRVIVWIHEHFGGALTMRSGFKPNHRDVIQWMARSNKAARFLRMILPYLRMKREQAEIALTFQQAKSGYRKKMLSSDEIKHREGQMHAIRELNGRARLKVVKDDN